VASPQLYLPVNRPVKFTLQSKDVLHDFWVPAFRIKKDAVPGLDITYRVTPNREGTYPIVCAELCGLGHAVMRANVHVVKQDAFDKFVTNLRSPKPAGGGGGGGGGGATAADGKTVFTSGAAGCTSCHTLSDAGATGKIGPDLDTALKGKDDAFIHESIVDPDKFVENGYQPGIMPPNFEDTLQPTQIDALVKYLSDVTKGG